MTDTQLQLDRAAEVARRLSKEAREHLAEMRKPMPNQAEIDAKAARMLRETKEE